MHLTVNMAIQTVGLQEHQIQNVVNNPFQTIDKLMMI